MFLGGDEIFDLYTKYIKKLDPYRAPDIIPELGPMRSERALSFFLLLAATSKVKKQALVHFVEHAADTRAFLESKSASSGPEAAWAKAVLTKLPKA